jgi:hypothetical protein
MKSLLIFAFLAAFISVALSGYHGYGNQSLKLFFLLSLTYCTFLLKIIIIMNELFYTLNEFDPQLRDYFNANCRK